MVGTSNLGSWVMAIDLQKKEHFSMILRILRQCEAFCQGAMCSAPRDLLSNIGASVSPLTCGNALPSWVGRWLKTLKNQ